MLVPLCGKTLDMHWLAQQGHTVVGLELVQQAIETFFLEDERTPVITTLDRFTTYTSPPYTILHGDVLKLEAGTVQADAWYDRAALIALPVESRGSYVEQLRRQTKPGATGLLITFTYPQHQMQGPPFSLEHDHVVGLFSEHFDIEKLDHVELEDDRGRGLSPVSSSVYKLTRR